MPPNRDYSVTGQQQVRGLVNGQLTDMLEVYWSGPANITGSVRVPTASASAERVDQLIRAQLDERLRIHQLGAAGGQVG